MERRNEENTGYPSNQELMLEIRRNRKIMYTILVFLILVLAALLGFGFYINHLLATYEEDIHAAFETMEKLDQMVENLQSAYDTYSGKVDDLFETVQNLKEVVDTVKRTLGSLPFFG